MYGDLPSFRIIIVGYDSFLDRCAIFPAEPGNFPENYVQVIVPAEREHDVPEPARAGTFVHPFLGVLLFKYKFPVSQPFPGPHLKGYKPLPHLEPEIIHFFVAALDSLKPRLHLLELGIYPVGVKFMGIDLLVAVLVFKRPAAVPQDGSFPYTEHPVHRRVKTGFGHHGGKSAYYVLFPNGLLKKRGTVPGPAPYALVISHGRIYKNPVKVARGGDLLYRFVEEESVIRIAGVG